MTSGSLDVRIACFLSLGIADKGVERVGLSPTFDDEEQRL